MKNVNDFIHIISSFDKSILFNPKKFCKTPLLISVQDFAFRGRPVSLLVAALLRGLTCLAFPAGVFVLHSNQQLELPQNQ
jgi:hypothetical protein